MTTRESTIQRAIVDAIKQRGGWAIVTTPPGVPKGTPDIIGCYRQRMLAIEVKRDGGRPTELQYAQMERWNDAGGIAEVVWSLAEAQALLDEIDRDVSDT